MPENLRLHGRESRDGQLFYSWIRGACACATLMLVLATAEHLSAQTTAPMPQPPTPSLQDASSQPPKVARASLFAQASQPRGKPREPAIGQSITLTGNVLGGYDDNAGASVGLGPGAGSVPTTRGTTGFADVMLEYLRKGRGRWFGIRTLGNIAAYPGYLDRPAPGAKVRVFGTTELGRKHTLEASAQVRYEPFFVAAIDEEARAMGSSAADLGSPTAAGGVLAASLFERRSWVSSNKAYLTRRWTPRDSTVVSYLYFAQRFADRSGDQTYQEAAAHYSRRLGRRMDVGASYSYHDGRQSDYASGTRPLTRQTVAGHAGLVKRLTASRQLSASVGAGGAYVESVDTVSGEPYDIWAPYASAAAAVDLTRTWKLSSSYRRAYSMLHGLSAQIYATDAADLLASGRVTPLIDVVIGGTFANGQTVLAARVDERFKVYGPTCQVRLSLTSRMAVTANYAFYSLRYSNPSALPAGFPARRDRNAFMVGVSFSSSGRLRSPMDW